MNRFRTKKKAPEPLNTNTDALQALSSVTPPQVSPTTNLKKSGTSRWRKGKKVVEAKPDVAFALTLPSNDDFRTSLLMPNLSARFSMLREQDDPNSLLGKASDDSVLQPRRRSRMDYGLGNSSAANRGLADIAEDSSSIDSSIRPPFAYGRQDSFTSEDGYFSENESSQSGSVLSRARPGEGNTLFGGRQKVYMIAKGGASSASSTKSLGRVVYEDDIGTSTFQRYRREREREAQEGRASDESHGFDFGLDHGAAGGHYDRNDATPNDSARDLSDSPSLSSSEKKRSTNSTSHSDARSSTAATSIASQPVTTAASPAPAPHEPLPATAASPPTMNPLKRSDTKTRRLYEQGLDQHMQEQQTSALSRLNSIQKQRTLGSKQAPYLHSTKSTGNLHEKVRQPVYALEEQDSPQMAPLVSPFATSRFPSSGNASPNPSMPVSPMTPHGMELDEYNAFTQALEPADRGKATAMGAFNKPKQSFDEEQYLERQRQLQRSNSKAAVKKDSSAPSVVTQRLGSLDQERERSGSNASWRSRSPSIPSKHEASKAYSVFQRAAGQNGSQATFQQPDKSALPDTHHTFFGNIRASDSEEEDEDHSSNSQSTFNVPDYGYGTQHGRWQPTILPSVLEHPALRSKKSKASLAEEEEDVDTKPLQPPMPIQTSVFNKPSPEDVDSPTLGVVTSGLKAAPLNSMMHHLRQKSNVSSIGQSEDRTSTIEPSSAIEPPPGLPSWSFNNHDMAIPTIDTSSRVGSYANSNPWDLEEAENTARDGERAPSRGSISPIDNDGPPSIFDTLSPTKTALQTRHSAVSMLEPESEPEATNETSWQNDSVAQHTRDASTATQQERDAFENELAARRIAAQEAMKEKMKSMAVRETGSRDASPAPVGSNAGFRPFNMLRSKTSSDLGERPQAAPKAAKMLGLGANGANASSTSLNGQTERYGQSFDHGRARDRSVSRPRMPNGLPRTLQQSEQDAKRVLQQSRSRENSEVTRPERMTQGSRSPASSIGGRSRANSEVAAGRSRSRTGPYRDDLEKAMMEGTGSSVSAVSDLPSPMLARELTPRASPDIVQSHFEPPAGRARSSTKTAMTDYFNDKKLHPIQTESKERLSPGAPSHLTSSPNTLSFARPSPVTSPFTPNMTPPLSGANTPVSSTFATAPQSAHPPPAPTPNVRHGMLRKKTISKYDISEPVLISSTSNVDTVDLPEGASLRNGMDEAPPIPPINPRRRTVKNLFSLARKESEDSITSLGSRSKTPDYHSTSKSPEPEFPFDAPQAHRSASSPMKPTTKASMDYGASQIPPGFFPSSASPEQAERSSPPAQQTAMEGGMF